MHEFSEFKGDSNLVFFVFNNSYYRLVIIKLIPGCYSSFLSMLLSHLTFNSRAKEYRLLAHEAQREIL